MLPFLAQPCLSQEEFPLSLTKKPQAEKNASPGRIIRQGISIKTIPQCVASPLTKSGKEGTAKVTLSVEYDPFQDGSGYQLLLDADHTACWNLYDPDWPLIWDGAYDPSTYEEFEYKIPEDATGSVYDGSWLLLGESASIEVPAGTYDLLVTNPIPNDYVALVEGYSMADDLYLSAGSEYIYRITESGCTYEYIHPVDLLVDEILAPVTGTDLSKAENIRISIRNNGTEDVSSLTATYTVDDGTPVEEQLSETIQAGSTYTYTFKTQADFSRHGLHRISVKVSITGDADNTNDAIATDILHQGPLSVPFVCSFDRASDTLLWNIMDLNQDDNSWYYVPLEEDEYGIYGGFVEVSYFEDLLTPPDAMVSSCPFHMDSGKYNLRFDYKSSYDIYPETLQILYGTSPDLDQMELLHSFSFLNENDEFKTCGLNMDIEETGEYYLAFLTTDTGYNRGVYLDNIGLQTGYFSGTPDLSVKKVLLPNSGTGHLSSTEQVGAVVANEGETSIDSLVLAYIVNGKDTVRQKFETVIPAYGSSTFYFEQKADFSQAGTYVVEVTGIPLPSDHATEETNLSNNAYTYFVHNYAPASVPFAVDFRQESQRGDWFYPESTWTYDSSMAAMACLSPTAMISRGVNLQAGQSYRFSADLLAGMPQMAGLIQVPETFTIRYGLSNTPVSDWDTIASYNELYTNYAFGIHESDFECKADGIYSFAIVPDTSYGGFNGTLLFRSTRVERILDHDIRINSFTSNIAWTIPESQVNNAYTAYVEIENRGLQKIESILMVVSTQDGTEVGRQTIEAPLGRGETIHGKVGLKLDGYAAGNTETLHLSATLPGHEDQNNSNNVDSLRFEVSQEWMIYDHVTEGMYNDLFCIGTSSTTTANCGLMVELQQEDVLTGLSIGWGLPEGQTVKLQIHQWDSLNGRLGDKLLNLAVEKAQGDTGQAEYTIPARLLPAGQYIFSVEYTGYLLVSDYSEDGILYSLASSGQASRQKGLGYPAIRARFGEAETPAKDVEITQMNVDGIPWLFTNKETLTVSLVNNGYEEVQGKLNLNVNGQKWGSEDISLKPYENRDVEFSVDLAEEGDYLFEASMEVEGDPTPDNNKMELTVSSQAPADPTVLDFESCLDFSIENFNPLWKTVDRDQAVNYGFPAANFPFPSMNWAFIVFNPDLTTPPMTGVQNIAPHGGKRFGASFASTEGQNDDWLISPRLSLTSDHPKLSFYVKSYAAAYGFERYNVLISTENDNPDSFVKIGETREAPYQDWELVEVDLSSYAGKTVYLAIQCVSQNAFIFMIDDISIKGASLTERQETVAGISLYPNPAQHETTILSENARMESLQIFNLSGQMAGNYPKIESHRFSFNVENLHAGIYFARILTDKGFCLKKFVVVK